jgi:hypothetical protein
VCRRENTHQSQGYPYQTAVSTKHRSNSPAGDVRIWFRTRNSAGPSIHPRGIFVGWALRLYVEATVVPLPPCFRLDSLRPLRVSALPWFSTPDEKPASPPDRSLHSRSSAGVGVRIECVPLWHYQLELGTLAWVLKARCENRSASRAERETDLFREAQRVATASNSSWRLLESEGTGCCSSVAGRLVS